MINSIPGNLKNAIWLMMAFLFCGCQDEAQEPNSTSVFQGQEDERNENWPVYKVGAEPDYAPFSLRDSNGEMIGYSKDLLEAIGNEEGFYVDFIPITWSNAVFNHLDNGSRDIISGGRGTAERKKFWAATVPIRESGYAFAVKDGSGINTIADLQGKKVSVQDVAIELDALESQYGDIIGGLVKEPTSYLAFESMLLGKSDAAFFDSAILSYYIANMPESYFPGKVKLIVPGESQADPYVFFIKKGNSELISKINNGINKLKHNGKFKTIQSKWFGEGVTE